MEQCGDPTGIEEATQIYKLHNIHERDYIIIAMAGRV
jgi:hypothetical protein